MNELAEEQPDPRTIARPAQHQSGGAQVAGPLPDEVEWELAERKRMDRLEQISASHDAASDNQNKNNNTN